MTSEAYMQVLGTGSVDLSPSLFVFTDTSRCIVNVGEGTQRFCMEHGVKLSRVTTVMLTRLCPETIGGLPGFILTLGDHGVDKLRLIGPPGVLNFVLAMRAFIHRCKVNMEIVEVSADQKCLHTDVGGITVQSILAHADYAGEADAPSPAALTVVHKHDVPTRPESSEMLVFSENYPGHVNLFFSRDLGRKYGTGKRKREVDETAGVDTECSEGLDGFDTNVPILDLAYRIPGYNQSLPRQKSDSPPQMDASVEYPSVQDIQELINRNLRCRSGIVAYAFNLPAQRGKFDPKRAKELGVPSGPLFGHLSNGNPITLPSGTIVHPHEVMSESEAGGVILVVDCPSRSYLDSLTTKSEFDSYFAPSSGISKSDVVFMIHMAPTDVIFDNRYIKWSRKFGMSIKHVLSHRDFTGNDYTFCGQTSQQTLFNMVSGAFQLPIDGPVTPDLSAKIENFKRDFVGEVSVYRPLTKISLLPLKKRGALDDSLPALEYSEIVAEFEKVNPELSKAIQTRKIEKESAPYEVEPMFGDATLTFLGTGSAIPSKYRNVSGVYLETSEEAGMMMDTGEGSLGQLYRCFGKDRCQAIIRRLKCIWISHIHADHHLGLPGILVEHSKMSSKPLPVFGPEKLREWLDEWRRTSCDKFEFDFRSIQDPQPADDVVAHSMGFSKLTHVPVIHCPYSYGLVAHHTNGWSLVYSGDTRPSPELIRAGRNSSIVIHEATFEDGMEDEAIARRHCTFSEAMAVAKDMGAKYTVLTHFSQRYPKLPSIASNSPGGTPQLLERTIFAFDLLSIPLARIASLGHILEGLREVMPEGDPSE